MIISCKQCGNQFETINKTAKFCSKSCFGLSISQKVQMKCDNCGKYTLKNPNNKKKNNFCSIECKRSFGSVATSCTHCNKPIFKQLNQLREKNFCSRECTYEWRNSNHFMSKTRTLVTCRCDFCNTEFETTPYQFRKNKNNFCSTNCFQEWKRVNTPSGINSQYYNRIEIKCDYCGNILYRNPWKIENRKNQFCNKKCHDNWYRLNVKRGSESPQYSTIEKPCSYCGKLLKRQPWQANGYEHTFCNKTCHGKWRSENLIGENNPLWQGGHTEYRGSNWHIQRYLARERDNNTCQHCGITRDQIGRELDVHHIIPFRHFDDYRIANALPNLITLCGSCHMRAEPRKGTI